MASPLLSRAPMIALRSLSLLAAVPLVLVAATARADERPTKPGLVLARGQLELAINFELEMSADKIGKPVSIAPDVAYGVSDDLTVALVHSLYGVTASAPAPVAACA